MNLLDKNRLNTGLNGEWLNDDEENGIHGTVLMAEDMNSLGTEINNLIKAGGMNPNKNENDQILRAVKNLGGSGVASSASNVSYDNSISFLEQKNYDFPKFKVHIDDLTYISLTESAVMGKIEKEEDNYFLKGSVSAASSQNILPISLTIDGKEDYEVLSFIGQFFNIDYGVDIENLNWTDALENEIIVNGINNGWQFVFVRKAIGIKRKDNGEIPENTYSVTLNIKNRVLLKPDENIIAWQIGINDNIVLKIVNENGTTKIKGITNTYAGVRSEDIIFFANNILENYITLDTEHTIGIKSSSGKNVVWTFSKTSTSSSSGFITIKYDDESSIQAQDFFTIDITADKNSNIDFTKGDAVNVQNAIDSLSELKQDKLTAGENIVIEKQGESTIIKSLGGGEAEDIGFDNTNAQLELLAGYDFPKFKIEIPETINLVLADADNTAEYQAAIIKQADGSYVLNASIENYTLISHSQSIFFIIKSIDSNINVYQIYSILSQFFSFNSIYNLELNECRISNIEDELKSTIGFITESYTAIAISKQDLTNFNQGSYNITLNIKNRVLRNEDRNIFASSFAFMSSQSVLDCYNFTLEQDNNNVKLKGEYTLKEGAGVVIGFYSPIIENYFNVSSGAVNIQNTTGITSSSGKPLKFGIYKDPNPDNSRPPYILFVGYQDDSTIQVGDTITFNLTPDKNSTLNPIYQNVTNVQEAVEEIVRRLAILES
ncbi:hypothetical protein [Brachyspira murdochii]|uniref:Hvp 101 VSH-1 tail protein n=1 Tax=Brachyspira murdochii TaxID=84378 RepID=A0ABX5B473_9SPIR|nr:hypothetical protein [Brachyspira murdochii]PPS21017.1 hypothetical protein DJ52_13295 [Brachyspira murdochii]